METSLKYEEQAEEAGRLSFCDLISSDDASVDWDLNRHKMSHGSSGEEEDESLIFDFFSRGFSFTTPLPAYPPETIAFCGKQLFPDEINNGDNTESAAASKKKNDSKLKAGNLKKKVINWMTPSSSSIFRSHKTTSGSSSSSSSSSTSSSSSSSASKQKRKNAAGTNRIRSKGPDQISIPSSKRKWWMLMLGSMRVPNEMELADIKTRQERRPLEAKKAFVAMFEDHEQQRNKFGMETKTARRRCSGDGLIGVVRSFSCKGYFHAGGQTKA